MEVPEADDPAEGRKLVLRGLMYPDPPHLLEEAAGLAVPPVLGWVLAPALLWEAAEEGEDLVLVLVGVLAEGAE